METSQRWHSLSKCHEVVRKQRNRGANDFYKAKLGDKVKRMKNGEESFHDVYSVHSTKEELVVEHPLQKKKIMVSEKKEKKNPFKKSVTSGRRILFAQLCSDSMEEQNQNNKF